MIATMIAALAINVMGPAADAPFVSKTFDQACVQAAKQGRQVLIYFSDPTNPQCRSYDELTWPEASVRAWLQEHVVAIEVDRERYAPLYQRYDVRLVPTLLVVSPKGFVRARIIGFRDADSLLLELGKKLQASDSVTLARVRAAGRSENTAASLMYAKTLEEAGRIDEALTSYLKCFHRDADAAGGYGGIQLVVIDELGRLADQHAQVRKALLQLRDASRDRILHAREKKADAAVFSSANAWLGELDDTLSVYKKLRDRRPESLTLRLLRECAVDAALKLKQYDRIAELIDVVGHARVAYRQYRRDIAKPPPAVEDPAKFLAFERHTFVERMTGYYEMLIGSGRFDDASAVASILLTVDPGAETYHALARAALRTDHPMEVNAIQARKAVELSDPPAEDTIATLVEILLRLDQRNEAAHVLERYMPRLGSSPTFNALRKRALTPPGG